ncbi:MULTISPECIES: Scr1 family TA system antitoxin-like transcriptional regulator [Actinomadura]|uniref:Scr1 family TA system antitoxin-like transcriptional regulator n=1 Tax=Actinomadura yumaensis TaxID=111807 RepID=A0ABW2CZM7_9ACTN|nr:Scr1 family TA system antitoxin-like transcriptional regulator [Actinomadura sp. J1-007]MWK34216.1 hypothetical protein [Actinomadura sp. J1-007]
MSARDSLEPDRSLWDLIAVELRRQREERKISGTRLGIVLGCDRSTVSRYESGTLRLPEKHAKILDREWRLDLLFTRLVHFAKAGKNEDWFTGLTEYEAHATRLKMWEVLLVPGLLQTPEYARAALSAGLVEDVELELQKRMSRQQAVFERPKPPQISVVLNWVTLAQTLGDAEVMRGQFTKLLELSELPYVNVRILEESAGAHVGMDGCFQLLTVNDRDIAYAEAPQMGRLIRDPRDVQHIAVRYDRVGEVATPVGPSRTLIKRALERYR